MTTQTLIIFETDPEDEATIYLRGLGLHVELNFADPGTRYNPDGAGILAQPDAMEGIVGHGATREAAAQACCDRLLELLRSPAEMFDALAAGAERAAGLEWAAAERHEHKDTPLNNEAHWHVIQRSTMQTAATLMRASLKLASAPIAAARLASVRQARALVRLGLSLEQAATLNVDQATAILSVLGAP